MVTNTEDQVAWDVNAIVLVHRVVEDMPMDAKATTQELWDTALATQTGAGIFPGDRRYINRVDFCGILPTVADRADSENIRNTDEIVWNYGPTHILSSFSILRPIETRIEVYLMATEAVVIGNAMNAMFTGAMPSTDALAVMKEQMNIALSRITVDAPEGLEVWKRRELIPIAIMNYADVDEDEAETCGNPDCSDGQRYHDPASDPAILPLYHPPQG